MELMFDIQSSEQPPAEIIHDLAPGLKFDENGIPIMANMGAGTMPENMGYGLGGGSVPDLGDLQRQMQGGQCVLS